MDRRDFLKSGALLAAAPAVAGIPASAARPAGEPGAAPKAGPLIDSAPMLQNYAATSVGVAFGVSDTANGYVVVGREPDLSDGRLVWCGGHRFTAMDSDVAQVRLTGLEPSTTYYYRIGADRIAYKGGYNMRVTGREEDSRVYSFTTAGERTPAHFCVINDTHNVLKALAPAMAKLQELRPGCVVWNGDTCDTQETMAQLKATFLTPAFDQKDYAARVPYLLAQGNHDYRGLANRHLERVWMFRQPEERSPRDWDLGRNFAVRMGQVALVGLDTGEDKLDTNPLFCHLFASGPYREAQALWLRDALNRPEIASAPYLVAFCHIPLFSDDPRANPGDAAPADKDPRYDTDYAAWQRTCARLWGPLLTRARCQLVVAAHQHTYRYDEPGEGRSWAQVVGGGPEMSEGDDTSFATVLEGKVEQGELRLTVHNLKTGGVAARFAYKPRKTSRRPVK